GPACDAPVRGIAAATGRAGHLPVRAAPLMPVRCAKRRHGNSGGGRRSEAPSSKERIPRMPLRPPRRLAAIIVLPLAFAALAPGARAQSAAPSSPVEAAPVAQDGALPVTDHAPLVVTGVQPGPGLWKVSKGDHVM